MGLTPAVGPAANEALVDTTVPAAGRAARLLALDRLRGLIMIVMALDHANYFIAHAHSSGEFWDRPLPDYPNALAFLTRFVTHIAAPGFFFLMGAGMVTFTAARRRSGWGEGAISRHFFIRGALLIGLQVLVENPAWSLGQPPGRPGVVYIGVLYALGAAMILGIVLLRLPTALLAVLGLAIPLATEWLLRIVGRPGVVTALLRLVLVPGFTFPVQVLYPALPWLAVVALGMLFGRALLRDPAQVLRAALPIGVGALALFVVVRLLGGFGNIRPAPGRDWMALLNVVKYPPSVTFLLLTLGIDLCIVGVFARVGAGLERWGAPLLVFGGSPLLFYLLHLYLYGLIGLALGPGGTSIVAMYPLWLVGLAVLFLICRFFATFKHARPADSLWRFL